MVTPSELGEKDYRRNPQDMKVAPQNVAPNSIPAAIEDTAGIAKQNSQQNRQSDIANRLSISSENDNNGDPDPQDEPKRESAAPQGEAVPYVLTRVPVALALCAAIHRPRGVLVADQGRPAVCRLLLPNQRNDGRSADTRQLDMAVQGAPVQDRMGQPQLGYNGL